ncbi:exosortase/archaeosortase family protein, partial [bacterium]|nr:exosortase/archaeosortase family protein [bacterium]
MSTLLVQSAMLLVIPVTEALFLRWLLHSALGLRIGFVGFTDSDFIFPMPLSFLFCFWTMNQARQFRFKLNTAMLLFNLALLSSFVGLNTVFYLRGSNPSGFWMMGLWWLLFVGIVASALLIWIGFWQFLTHPSRRSVVPALLVGFSIVVTQNWGGMLWPLISRMLEGSLEPLLPFKLLRSSSHLILVHPALTLRIGLGCSGLDGLLFYMATFLLVWPLGGTYFLTKWRWAKVFVIGLVLQYILNLLRISLLFGLGIGLVRLFGVQQGTSILMNFFHVHLGYVLYASVLIPYFIWGLGIFRKQEEPRQDSQNSSPFFRK